MIQIRRTLFAVLALLASSAWSAPLPATAQAEVQSLLTRLQQSGCQFERNGSWHSGDEARAHLLRKLQYLEDKNLVDSTEQFIERAATGSSMSGQAYRVRCGQADPVNSAAWMTAQLKQLRAAPKR